MPWQSILEYKKHTRQGHGTLQGTLFVFFVGALSALWTLQGVILQLANLNGLIPLGQVIQYTSLGVQQARLSFVYCVICLCRWLLKMIYCQPATKITTSLGIYSIQEAPKVHICGLLGVGLDFSEFEELENFSCRQMDSPRSRSSEGATCPPQFFIFFCWSYTAVAASVFCTKMKDSGIN